MAKKALQSDQPDLFSIVEQGLKPEPKKIAIPTEEEVRALVNRTGKSTRKCYFWLLTEKNKVSP